MSPRHRATRTPVAVPEVQNVQVSSVRSVASACRIAINKVINRTWLSFQQGDSKERHKQIMLLVGDGATSAVAQYEYVVVPFLTTKHTHTQYWLGASLVFYFPPGTGIICLTNVSLSIFEGSPTDPQKHPILRAEWDCNEDYHKNVHAQPHWHVYSSLLNKETDFPAPTAFHEINVVQNFPSQEQANIRSNSITGPANFEAEGQDQPTWTGGKRFHFALAARWQPPISEPQNEVLDPTKLGNWIERCLRYISEQLEYIDIRR